MSFYSGFVGIFGAPNVGKSTLLNYITGAKLAIVSPRPQTTRNRIMGILNGENSQIVFVDTPGIHRPRTALHKSMVESSYAAFNEVDILLLMIETQKAFDQESSNILRRMRDLKKPCLLVINKIDIGPKEALLPIIDHYRGKFPFEAFLPVSALNGEGIDALVGELRSRLDKGPQFFPPDMETDQSESFMVSEIIREKIYLRMKKELPYSSAVTVDTIEEASERNLISIKARIHVETESQKKIFIGRRGENIKEIGTSARKELEEIFESRIFLDLTVVVSRNWSRDSRILRNLGY